MNRALLFVVMLSVLLLGAAQPASRPARSYAWLTKYEAAQSLASRIAPPAGCQRIKVEAGTFADWLRNLPLKPNTPPVLLFDGQRKTNQDAHVAVLDLDVGGRDLQQCADSVIRLRAEYLWSKGQTDKIAFHFTSGDLAEWSKWSAGDRPIVHGNKVRWARTAAADDSYRNFRAYLDTVFMYAGTLSLAKEMRAFEPTDEIEIGDVFVRGGSPGHALIVVDMVQDTTTGKKLFLLAQGYTPAQEMHLLKNPNDAAKSPWYDAVFEKTLKTPEWTFDRGDLRRF